MNESPMHKPGRLRRNGLRSIVAMLAYLSSGLVCADAVDARLDELHAYLGACTRDFGYDPQRTGSFADHEIAPGEAKWRGCAYEGIRKIMVPNSATPAAYDTLIALDKVMTREIPGGKRTRGERKQRIGKMVDGILAREKASTDGKSAQSKVADDAELLKQRDQLLARQREMQKMRRLQVLIR